MNGKITSNKAWKKTGFGILFVAACFMAMYILMEFHEVVWLVVLAAVVLLGAAFLFFHAVFSDKTKTPGASFEAADDTAVGGGEFHLKIVKHMKDMENSQKEMVEVLKSQNALLQAQTENLENSLFSLSEKQANQTKSIIKFNKENARQLAISERETLEYVMLELKKAIEDTAEAIPVKTVDKTEPVLESVPVLEEVTGEELIEVSELPADDEFVVPDFPVEEDVSDELDLTALFEDIAEAAAEESKPAEVTPVEEIKEEPAEEPVVAADPLAGLGADPNAMMTPEDIAKLLEAMGQ